MKSNKEINKSVIDFLKNHFLNTYKNTHTHRDLYFMVDIMYMSCYSKFKDSFFNKNKDFVFLLNNICWYCYSIETTKERNSILDDSVKNSIFLEYEEYKKFVNYIKIYFDKTSNDFKNGKNLKVYNYFETMKHIRLMFNIGIVLDDRTK